MYDNSSKRLEKIMLDHLLKHTKPFLDPTHNGGFKGSSTAHYLINLLDFSLKNLDNPEIIAIIMVLVKGIQQNGPQHNNARSHCI